MAAEWSAFIKLVSVRGRIFSVPLTLGMLPICWPQPQTCVQLSHFQASFHLINTHTYTHTHTHMQSLACLSRRPQNQIKAQGTFLLLGPACQLVDMINTLFSCHSHWNMFAIFPTRWCVCLCSVSLQLAREPGQSDTAALPRECSEQKILIRIN